MSVVEAAADALREKILDGSLEPGARLRETDYSQRLGIARHTFRAATQILVAEGLLIRLPNRGVQLAILDADGITDVFRLRSALELEAVRSIVASGEPGPSVEEAVERLEGMESSASWRTVVDADLAFHRAIIDSSGSERIARAYAGVESEIMLCMAQLRPFYDRLSVLALEHRELFAPIAAGDLELAERRFRAHLEEAAETLTQAHRAQERVTG